MEFRHLVRILMLALQCKTHLNVNWNVRVTLLSPYYLSLLSKMFFSFCTYCNKHGRIIGSYYALCNLNSYSTTLSESHKVYYQNSDPTKNSNPSCENGKDKWNRCVNAIVSSSFKRQIFMQIIHKVKDRPAGQSRL